jgi:hypothetical protein
LREVITCSISDTPPREHKTVPYILGIVNKCLLNWTMFLLYTLRNNFWIIHQIYYWVSKIWSQLSRGSCYLGNTFQINHFFHIYLVPSTSMCSLLFNLSNWKETDIFPYHPVDGKTEAQWYCSI